VGFQEGINILSGPLRDARLTLRRLLRRPLYPAIATVILALGLSASIGAFTYLNAFRQPFPGVRDSGGLFRILDSEPENPFLDLSYLDFQDYARSVSGFSGLVASQPFYAASVRHEDMTEVAFLEAVSGDYFDVLGVELSLGRGLAPSDDVAGAEAAAVISHAWWQRQWGGEPGVIGETLYLNYRPFVIVGVAAPSFLGVASEFRPDVWIPIAPFRDRYTGWDAQAQNREVPLVRVYGRLAPGENLENGREELSRLAQGLDEGFPRADHPRRIRVEPATWIDPRTGIQEARTNRILSVVVAGFLLLVCANVANLLLALFGRHRHSMALQSALGASPGRLARQALLEGILLAGVAGGIGLALARPLGARLGSYFARPSVWGADVAREFTLDGVGMAFAVGVSLVVGILAALLPAVRAMSRDLVSELKGGATALIGSPGGGGRWSVRSGLVVAQVALASVLVTIAGLTLRTLSAVSQIDPGFRYEGLMGSHISTSSTGVQVEERDAWFHDVADQISSEPWVESATVSQNSPLSPHGMAPFRIDDRGDPQDLVVARVHRNFFDVLGVELLEGRTFQALDTVGARPVAIVNQPARDRLFPGGQALGRSLRQVGEGGEQEFEVVGVVGPVRVRDFLRPAEPAVYFPFRQHAYGSGAGLVVRTRGDPVTLVPSMNAWLRAYEPHMAIVNVLPYSEVVQGWIYAQRMNAEMFSALAFLALCLAAAGVFAVVSLQVVERTREIGIRRAVGGSASSVVRGIVLQSTRPVLVGIGLGVAASLVVARMAEGLLLGVDPWDVPTLLATCAVLLIVALLAAYLPATRAGRVHPMEALRTE
jgi:predicted permease